MNRPQTSTVTKDDMAIAAIAGLCLLLVMAAFFSIGIRWERMHEKSFPCELDTDTPFVAQDKDGMAWHQVTAGIVGCSVNGITVLVPAPTETRKGKR